MFVLTKRVGFFNAAKVLVFIMAWGATTRHLGRAPESIEEYADDWGQSVRTSYRELALFRKALKGETDPTRIWEQVAKQLPSDADAGAAALGSVSPMTLGIAGL